MILGLALSAVEDGGDPLSRLLFALAVAAGAVVAAGQQLRSYEIAAVTVNVPFNRWGRILRNARVFVLEQRAPANGNQRTVFIGHYNTVERTVRAAPVTNPGGVDEKRLELDLPHATTPVDASGMVKLRLIADNGSPFGLALDQLVLTAVNRR